MNRTGIEWCDWTWNPLVGCAKVSPGCDNCYAQRMSRRHAKNPALPENVRRAHRLAQKEWERRGDVSLIEERLSEPMQVRKPGRVFVCSMSDIGGASAVARERIVRAMLLAPWHQYIVLTKRPGPWLMWLPRRIWVGVSVENQEQDWRVRALAKWANDGTWRFVSVEPMLGPVLLKGLPKVEWVIAGPETGPGARPCEDAWIDALAEESTCFFDKRKVGWKRREWPA